MRPLVDLSFGINEQALAVLHCVNRQELTYDVANIQTVPWYNGRERGVLICVTHAFAKPSLCVAIYENRTSDHIMVASWKQEIEMNPPSCFDAASSRAGKAIENAQQFKCGEYHRAASVVATIVESYLKPRKRVQS